MRKAFFTLTVAVLGAASLAVALALPDAGMRRLTVDGVERTYYLHVPAGLPPNAPLVIMLHGIGNDGKGVARGYGWEDQADTSRFVVAGPDASRVHPERAPSRRTFRMWNIGRPGDPASILRSDDVGFIVAMIDDIARTAGIDRSRVYVAGFSNGGHMANRLGQEIAGRLAAVSTSASQMLSLSTPPSRGIPILYSAGDRDPETPVEAGRTELPGGGVSVRDAQRTLVDRWRGLHGCPTAHTIAAPTDVVIEVSGPCRDGSEVRYILMRGVDHKWPLDKPIDLTQTSWDFFKRFSLPADDASERPEL
jgi:polyhydroxybutyrate depolymerase